MEDVDEDGFPNLFVFYCGSASTDRDAALLGWRQYRINPLEGGIGEEGVMRWVGGRLAMAWMPALYTLRGTSHVIAGIDIHNPLKTKKKKP